MESEEIRQALRDADRAEAAPWTDYPPTPWWYVPVASVWTGFVVASLSFSSRLPLFALVAAELGFLHWYRRHRGMWPSGPAPREYRKPIALMVMAMVASLAAAWAVSHTVGPWWSGATMTVLAALNFAWYERAYADAARRARRRLA